MKKVLLAFVAWSAGVAGAQTQIVAFRWGENGVHESVTACWFDSVSNLVWLAGSIDDGVARWPAMWTVDAGGVIADYTGVLPAGAFERFGSFSANGQFVTLHVSQTNSDAGHDDVVVRRQDWSSAITFPGSRPGSFAYQIQAVGDEGQACGQGNPFVPGSGAFVALPAGGQFAVTWLDDMPGGIWAPLTFSMSRHAEVLAGYSFDQFGFLNPLAWSENAGQYGVSVLAHPDFTDAIAGRVSPDARFIAGSVTTLDAQLCVWNEGVPHLFDLGGSPYMAHPRWALDDGTIFGWTWTTPRRAFIANAELLPQPQLLEDYFVSSGGGGGGGGFAEPGESWVSQALLGGGSYHVVFNGQSGRSYYLRVPALGAGDCRPDLNDDGVLNFFDVQLFLSWFSAHDDRSDFIDDGVFNFFDVQAFLSAFAAGCP
ncbi:MAG: hypothetical protein KJZ65_13165 [Phycisphaerales bacterium]|nr:hypothetical protein [Phycisphaerales bacterium]